MLKMLISASALTLLVAAGGTTAQAAYGHATDVANTAAAGFVQLALNPQPEPPNKPQKGKRIKKGDPGKNK